MWFSTIINQGNYIRNVQFEDRVGKEFGIMRELSTNEITLRETYLLLFEFHPIYSQMNAKMKRKKEESVPQLQIGVSTVS